MCSSNSTTSSHSRRSTGTSTVSRRRQAATRDFINSLMSQKLTPMQFLDSAIQSNTVVVFSTSFCCESLRIKALLERPEFNKVQAGIKIIDLDTLPEARILMAMQPTPSVWINGRHLGGNDEVRSAYQSGELARSLHIAQ